MKRLLGQTLAIATLGVLATALTPACAENDQSIYIRSVLAPPQNRQNGACLYTSDPTAPMLFGGEVDTAVLSDGDGKIVGGYTAILLVGSQLIGRGDPTAPRTESNRVHINGVVVRVTDANGGFISEFTAPGSGTLEPQLNNTPAFGLVGATVLDPDTLTKIRALAGNFRNTPLILVNMKAFGKTVGGVDVESGEFQFPVSVCKGCLLSVAIGDDPSSAGPDCKLGLGANTGTSVVLPCRPGQDEGTPCQVCSGKYCSGASLDDGIP